MAKLVEVKRNLEFYPKLCKLKSVKLAASVAMNSHYHPYSDLSSPHPPSPDNNNYGGSMTISGGNGGNGNHHNGHGPMMSMGGQQQGFHQLNNNNTMMNKCAGCGSKYHYICTFFSRWNGHVQIKLPNASQIARSRWISDRWSKSLRSIIFFSKRKLFSFSFLCVTGKIAERYLLSAIDKFWHHTCLKCSCCGALLADIGSSCFTRGNMILCKADYSRWVSDFQLSAENAKNKNEKKDMIVHWIEPILQ